MASAIIGNHMETNRPQSYFLRVTLEEANFTISLVEQTTSTSISYYGNGDEARSSLGVRWSSLLLAAFMILGACGNALVCIAIFTDRRLQNVTNYFLFSLAVADLLVSLIVMPFSILTELHDGYWHYGFTLCAGYSYADVFLCSASIVHMSIISLDRYLGISRPLKTRNKSKLVVTFKIIAVWIITTTISCPIAILAIVHPRDIYHDRVCSIDNPYFLIYGSTLAFLIPCLIMVATYVRTTQLLRQQALLCSGTHRGGSGRSQDGVPSVGLRRTRTRQRRNSKRGSSTRKRHGSTESRSITLTSRRNSPASSSEANLKANSIKRYRPNLNHELASEANANAAAAANREIELQRNDRLQVILPTVSRSGSQQKRRRTSKCSDDDSLDPDLNAAIVDDDPQPATASVADSKTLRNKFRERTITLWNKTTKRSTSASELANEQKATRVLGLVFGCFVICWTPFFVQNFTMAFCGQNNCSMPHWLTSMFLWLGYLSSTINPIIYTTFNKRFRQAFANILRCRICCNWRSLDSQTRLSRASASSFHSLNNNYHHGYTNSQVAAASSPPGQTYFGSSYYGKCNISRTPPDLIAANAAVDDDNTAATLIRS